MSKDIIRYSEYKDSGIEWLGEIPVDWEVRRLKDLADVTLGKMLQNNDSGEDLLKPYLRSLNVQWEKVNISSIKKMWFSDYEREVYRLEENDIVVSEGGEIGRAAIWNNELEECYIQNSVHKVSTHISVNPYFLLFQFVIGGSSGHFDKIVNRVSIAHLTREKLVSIYFLKPPIQEQNNIAQYLNQKTAQIDQILQNKQQQITQLQNLRQITINQAVTKGLDSNAPMKDSGIEWLGEIPVDWEVKRLKDILSTKPNAIVDGPFGSSINVDRDYVEDGIPVVRTTNITNHGFNDKKLKFLRLEKYQELKRHAVFPEDILFSKVGTIGNVCLFPKNMKEGILSTTGSCKISVNFNRIRPSFLVLLLQSIREHFHMLASSNVQPFLNLTTIKQVYICFPSVNKQIKIIKHIQKETSKIDQLIQNLEKQITQLEALRKIEIYEAVTGKVKVSVSEAKPVQVS